MGISAPAIRRGNHRLLLFFSQGPIAERRPSNFLPPGLCGSEIYVSPLPCRSQLITSKKKKTAVHREEILHSYFFFKLEKKLKKQKKKRTKKTFIIKKLKKKTLAWTKEVASLSSQQTCLLE